MESEEFKSFRQRMSKTQKQMSQLLGISLKAVKSYEQSWRFIPSHVERHMFFLISMMKETKKNRKPCWVIKNCSPVIKKQCPAWEFKAGDLCWIIDGTMCCSGACKEWKDKMKCCRSCEVLIPLL
jgi:hypothetical protein